MICAPSVFEVLLRLALHRRRRADGHERRRFDHAVRSGQAAQARAGRIGGKNFETEIPSVESVSGELQPPSVSCNADAPRNWECG